MGCRSLKRGLASGDDSIHLCLIHAHVSARLPTHTLFHEVDGETVAGSGVILNKNAISATLVHHANDMM